MKKLSWPDKIIYFINIIFSILLLICYILPYFSPKHFPEIATISLTLPVLLIINVIFLFYWLFKLKIQLLLPAIVLILGFDLITNILVFGNQPKSGVESISLMSFNVRHFDIYDWLDKDQIPQQIQQFILEESPDIIAFQDFYENKDFQLNSLYPHRYVWQKSKQRYNGLAVFSKFPIVNTGSLNFPETSNNCIFADIVKEEDTIRLYNVHFESLKLKPDVNSIKSQDQKKLIGRVGAAFKKQVEQFQRLQKEIAKNNYKKIVAGDLNNTSYSYLYHQLRSENLKDAFIERGNGYGKTFDFDFIPLRIDVILVDDKLIQVTDFKNYNVKLSDHYPIKAHLAF